MEVSSRLPKAEKKAAHTAQLVQALHSKPSTIMDSKYGRSLHTHWEESKKAEERTKKGRGERQSGWGEDGNNNKKQSSPCTVCMNVFLSLNDNWIFKYAYRKILKKNYETCHRSSYLCEDRLADGPPSLDYHRVVINGVSPCHINHLLSLLLCLCKKRQQHQQHQQENTVKPMASDYPSEEGPKTERRDRARTRHRETEREIKKEEKGKK